MGPEQTVERLAYGAWPAAEVHELDGWRLRFMSGVSRRANSVWPGDAAGGMSLEERVDRVETWYAHRALPPVFQISPMARPARLDSYLAGRGYVVHCPVAVQVAAAGRVAALAPAADVTVRVEPRLFPEWFHLSAHRGRFAAVAETYRGLLDRIGPRARYALAEVDGQPAGVGLGVVDGPWMGIFSMMTAPEARRLGAGKAVLGGLAASAVAAGASGLYLLVEGDNAPALALYRVASFETLYGYHYRVPSMP
jgi:ribosomal protein S18 acetylase RimI-like enzyme